MVSSNFRKTVETLGQKLVLIEGCAHELSARLQTLRTKTELLKIDIPKRGLESRTKSLARQAGFKSITRDGRKLKAGLAAAAAGAFLGGAFAKNWLSAINSGISGFDGVMQGFGKSDWAVSLDGDLLVVPRNQITPGRTWVTLQSLLLALEEFKEKARAGEQLDNISAIVAKMKRSRARLVHLLVIEQLVIKTDSHNENPPGLR
jgi:hypothetical protein